MVWFNVIVCHHDRTNFNFTGRGRQMRKLFAVALLMVLFLELLLVHRNLEWEWAGQVTELFDGPRLRRYLFQLP